MKEMNELGLKALAKELAMTAKVLKEQATK
jgi:hypothetical protein